MPHDVSHTEADDDRILYNLIVIRNQQTKDSEVKHLLTPYYEQLTMYRNGYYRAGGGVASVSYSVCCASVRTRV